VKSLFRLCILAVAIALIGRPVPAAADLFRADHSIKIDQSGLPLKYVVRMLSQASGTSIVAERSIEDAPISVRIWDVDLPTALKLLSETYGFEVIDRGDRILIGPASVLFRRYASEKSQLGTVVTHRFCLQNSDPQAVQTALHDALPADALIAGDSRTRSVIVTADTTVEQRAAELVRYLDAPLYGATLGNGGACSATVPLAAETSRFFRLSHVDVETAVSQIKAYLGPDVAKQANIGVSPQAGVLAVTATPDVLAQITQAVSYIDTAADQVVFDVVVADYTPQNDTSNVGFEFGGASVTGSQTSSSGNTTTTFVNNYVAVNATLNAMVQKGTAQVLEHTQMDIYNNLRGNLSDKQTYPLPIVDPYTGTVLPQDYKTGISVDVSPLISAAPEDSITVHATASYSEIAGFNGQYPIINDRQVDTVLRVQEGQTIVLGGQVASVDQATINKVPVLGDIPLFGGLFRNKNATHTRESVVFLLTPHIVRAGNLGTLPKGDAANPGATLLHNAPALHK
jgi:type II secretory pathway component GspD/PulD (secretin)